MTDLYLKLSDEAAATAALYDGDVPKFRNIDTIGVIMKRTGGTDEEPVMTAVPGWHVNVRALADEDVSGLEMFVTNPVTPVRVWG